MLNYRHFCKLRGFVFFVLLHPTTTDLRNSFLRIDDNNWKCTVYSLIAWANGEVNKRVFAVVIFAD